MQNNPLISVILPVYNGAAYLRQTMDAILAQTETDFELLVIDDGSSDDSGQIIHSYDDSRIRYLQHPNNGIVYTLNRGIAEARGEYIARIDADDVCLPERFRLQARWLDEHPDTAMVACLVAFIDQQANDAGSWPEDRANVTNAQIRATLPFANCIAHPAVMVRTAILRKYHYKISQQLAEDYDMWLRFAGDGLVMEKVPEVLLQYRVHTASLTTSLIKKKNIFWRHYQCKRRYIAARLAEGRLNMFDVRVFAGMLKDLALAAGKFIKQKI